MGPPRNAEEDDQPIHPFIQTVLLGHGWKPELRQFVEPLDGRRLDSLRQQIAELRASL